MEAEPVRSMRTSSFIVLSCALALAACSGYSPSTRQSRGMPFEARDQKPLANATGVIDTPGREQATIGFALSSSAWRRLRRRSPFTADVSIEFTCPPRNKWNSEHNAPRPAGGNQGDLAARLHIDDGQLPIDNNRVENQIADRLRVGRIVLVRLDVDHGAIRVKHG